MAWLAIQDLPSASREVQIKGDSLIIGRDPGCDIVIRHRLASRQHARLSFEGGRYRLEDLESSNGTWLNGERLSPVDAGAPRAGRRLADGDRISVGGVVQIVFHDSEATDSPEVAKVVSLRLDQARRDVWIQGRKLAPRLPPSQYALLRFLLARAGSVCSRDEVAAVVRPGAEDNVSNEALDALVKRLRARLKLIARDRIIIKTVRGHGFMLLFPEATRRG